MLTSKDDLRFEEINQTTSKRSNDKHTITTMTDDSGRNSPVSSDGSESAQNDDGDVDDYVLRVPKSRLKKRVQFHSDENLVRIREIPPRGEQQTTDEEDSGCSEDEEDDDTWAGSGAERGASNIPVIVDNAVKLDNVAKGSYDVTKTKGRSSHIVSQITGVSVSNSGKSKQRRNSNKERKVKKLSKTAADKTDTSKSKHKTGKKKSQKRIETEKTVTVQKKSKDIKNSKPNTQNNKTAQSRPIGHSLVPLKKTPSKQDVLPSVTASLPNGFDSQHVRSTNADLRNMSVGKVFTMDGFIFPSDPSDQIKAKSVSGPSDSEVSKTVLQRKKCFAWHMANGDQHNVLFGTPCILPLWDSVQSYTPLTKSGLKTKI